MDAMDAIQAHEQTAGIYDRAAVEGGYLAPEALLGLCFEYLHPGQRLLDVGIGTGLSSLPFARAGMVMYGLDGSAEMLKECEKKHFAAGLKLWDLRSTPWPFEDQFFDHAIECGTLPFIADLEIIFSEAARLIKSDGIFGFMVKNPGVEEQSGKSTSEIIDGVEIYSHSSSYIVGLLAGSGFENRKQLKLMLSRGPGLQDDVYTVYVARKMGEAR